MTPPRFCPHGHDTHVVGRTGRRCTTCCTEYARGRSHRTRNFLRVYKSRSCCQSCGYSKCPDALVFHHRDPAAKLFSVAVYGNRSLVAVQAEIAKCDLLCSNCHAELHYEEKSV